MENKRIITPSLILTKRLFGDGHITFNALTRDIGLINAPAFGGQRLSKRFKGGLDHFQIVEIEIEEKINSGVASYNISSVKDVVKKFTQITSTMEKYTSASYVLELTSTILMPYEKAGKSGRTYFELAADCLQKIDSEKHSKEMITEVYNFTLELYRESGFLPNIEKLNGVKNMLEHLEELNSKIIGTAPKSFALLYKTYASL
ncbi:MAG: DNA repair protein RecO [Pseudomonadota bacterium]